MAEKTKKRRSSRYDKKKTAPKKSGSHWFRNSVLIFLAGFAFVLASYLGYLDYNVRTQFEGKRWAIPARVYASPVELYAGYNLSADEFETLSTGLRHLVSFLPKMAF